MEKTIRARFVRFLLFYASGPGLSCQRLLARYDLPSMQAELRYRYSAALPYCGADHTSYHHPLWISYRKNTIDFASDVGTVSVLVS